MIKAPAGMTAVYKDGTRRPIIAFNQHGYALILHPDRGQLGSAVEETGFVRIDTAQPSTPTGSPNPPNAYEAWILALPAPEGYRCPACDHGIANHRMHGCDVDGCDCDAPHGRIRPATQTPAPTRR